MSLAIQPVQKRRLATESITKNPANDQAGFTEWRTVYSLPSIRFVAAISKLKVYQTVLTAAGMPIVFALGNAGQLSTDALAIYSAVGISGLVTLTLASYAAANLVGFIYVNEQQDLIKLAYVDFWGRRQESLLETEDLLPSCEQASPSRLRFVSPICLRSDPKKRYKLLNRFGQVSDPQLFEGLFGD
ncbi:transmembrane protein 186 isoform X2 [Drosophila ficusphila]|nr:transmembrane protein 186 isoform X2 [Drosophila ficusphila]